MSQQSDANAISQQLGNLRRLLEKFLKGPTKEGTLGGQLDVLGHRFNVLEETLATVLNWFSLQKAILRALGAVQKLTEPNMLGQPEDVLRQTIRMGLLPQSETMAQNIFAANKGAQRILPLVERDLSNLAEQIKSLKTLNERFLKVIEFDLDASSGLITELLHSLYSGHLDVGNEKLARLEENIQKL